MKFKPPKKKKEIKRIHWREYEFAYWLLPVAIVYIPIDQFNKYLYKKRKWSDRKADIALDYILPRILEYDEDDDCFYYCTEWRNYYIWRSAPFFIRGWSKKFIRELKDYIINSYVNEDYEKVIEGEWIKFKEK